MSETDNRVARLAARGGWIAVDLDGTLAYYDHWRGVEHVGEPIVPMLERVRGWIAAGVEVRIFTARVSPQFEDRIEAAQHIQDWCARQGLPRLRVTCEKDFQMIEQWDDRAVQVVPNTGRTLAEEHAAELAALRGKP